MGSSKMVTSLRQMINRAMQDPDGIVLRVVYVDGEGKETTRVISPTSWTEANRVFRALCLGRAEHRQFVVSRIRKALVVPAESVLMPEPMTESNQPTGPGWHWFLPDERCPTPTGLLRLDCPVVLMVGFDNGTPAGDPPKLCVRFPGSMLWVENMSGDWEAIDAPERMRKKALERILDKQKAEGK